MTLLIAGLLLFLGTHSLRIVADPWRARRIAQLGEGPWKGIYTLVSLVGFALIVWGYGVARGAPVVVWTPPTWTRHLASLLTLPAFVLLAAAYVPGNRIRAGVTQFLRRGEHPLAQIGGQLIGPVVGVGDGGTRNVEFGGQRCQRRAPSRRRTSGHAS